MKDTLLRAVIFITSFVISLFIISSYLNRGTTDMTVEMEEATLPVVEILADGRPINRMFGVKSKMEPNMLRGTLTPLNEDRSLNIHIRKFGNNLREVAYEVRSLDASRLIEDTEILDYREEKEDMEATLHIKDLIEDGREYILGI
ncbi:MAG: hypothetical protein IJ857_05535, partial [Lachnospiraceae bacterium]|nr:hypothetical protein [Lachnospiraceae bacterium]